MADFSGVYAIVNEANGKFYIGSSISVNTRILGHKGDLRRGTHHSNHLQGAWDCYGDENFSFCVLERCDARCVKDREQVWLDATRCYEPGIGYNRDKVAKVTRDEAAKKIDFSMSGRKMSAETKAKIGAANGGKVRSEEVKAIISNSLSGRKGHPCSQCSKDKLIARNKARSGISRGKYAPRKGSYKCLSEVA